MDLFTAIAEEEKEWTINDIGRNSISEIHNNPNDPNKILNSQKQINYDSPVVPSTTIRKVKKSEFHKYENLIADEYDTYAENLYKKNETEKSNISGQSNNVGVDNGATEQLKSIVPEIFFQEDFNLENPLIFDQVCENVNVTSDIISDMAANNILQEQLSNYLDVVEVNLMSEISKKRESFFSALSSLKTLYKEIDECVDEIQNLKVQLKDVSKCETQKGLEVVCMKRKRVNLENLYNGIRLLSEVRQTQPTIQILLGQNDYIGALGLIEETNNAMRGYNYQTTKPLNGVVNIENSNQLLSSSKNISPIRSPISILSSNTYANSNYSYPLDLRGVKGLKNINGQLVEMSKAIEMMMQNEFVQVLMEDIYSVDRKKSENSLKIPNNNSMPRKDHSNSSIFSDSDDKPLIAFRTVGNDNIDVIPDIKELVVNEEILYTKLSPLIFGLLRTNKFLNASASFKNEIQNKFTDIIKRKFASLYDVPPDIAAKLKSENVTEETMALNKIKNLTFEKYYDLLEKYYSFILSLLRRISIIKCLINDIIVQAEKKNIVIGMINEENQSVVSNKQNDSLYINTDRNMLESDYKSSNVSVYDYNRIKKEFLTLINQIVDIFYGNCSRMLTIRAEKNSQLSSLNFHRLYNINTEFINACEKLTKRSYLTLKSNLLSQAKIYINAFHQKKIKQMVNDIETDQWVPAEISENNQEIVNKITQKEWSSIAELCTISSYSSSSERANKNGNKKNINRSLFIEKKKYIVAACTMTFINTLSEYIGCAEVVPILTLDIINSVYSLLQVFNSKVCQIIIGGGAVTSGGLKYIAAKHLALASRSLGAVKALIPYIRNFLQSKLLTKQLVLLNDLDRYSKDYDNHQIEIYDKLVSIMNGKLESHCKSFQAMDWELPEVPTQPNVYMLLMVKDLTSLYRLLSKIIPIDIIQSIMKEVLTNYTTRLEKELGTVEIYSSNAKNRLLIDFQYYIQKLSLLDGIDGPGNRLEVVVNNITIKENKPTLEQKTIINEYIRQSFDSGSRRSSIYDENSSSYTNSPIIMDKNEDNIVGNEKPSNSPFIMDKNPLSESMDRLTIDNLSQDELSLDSNNETININNAGHNELPSSSLNQSISLNNTDDEDESNINTQIDDNVTADTTINIHIDTTTDINNKHNSGAVSAITTSGMENGVESDYFDNRHNSAPDNSFIEASGSDQKYSNSEEKNQNFKSPDRKSSYTLNKKTFSVFSQNVKKFGSEIKKHYSNNSSMESLFGLDKMVSKSNSLKSLSSSTEHIEEQSNNKNDD